MLDPQTPEAFTALKRVPFKVCLEDFGRLGFCEEIVEIQAPPDRIGLMVEKSHPQVIGLDQGNPFLRTHKRILRGKYLASLCDLSGMVK